MHYLTGIIALNYYNYDWHTTQVDYLKKYNDNVLKWSSYGLKKEKPNSKKIYLNIDEIWIIANPYRAFMDYIYDFIVNKNNVPNLVIDNFLFNDKETQKLLNLIEKYLRPVLTTKQQELLNNWLKYNKGEIKYGKIVNKSKNRKQSWFKRIKTHKLYGKNIKTNIK